jgi:hypothetical protein
MNIILPATLCAHPRRNDAATILMCRRGLDTSSRQALPARLLGAGHPHSHHKSPGSLGLSSNLALRETCTYRGRFSLLAIAKSATPWAAHH